MAHAADKWIAENWQDKVVRQATGIPELVGRTGRVQQTFFDEKGALHCLVDAGGSDFWCPALHLEIVQTFNKVPFHHVDA
jgi:hypothetical protein